jgi:hypothetical protein
MFYLHPNHFLVHLRCQRHIFFLVRSGVNATFSFLVRSWMMRSDVALGCCAPVARIWYHIMFAGVRYRAHFFLMARWCSVNFQSTLSKITSTDNWSNDSHCQRKRINVGEGTRTWEDTLAVPHLPAWNQGIPDTEVELDNWTWSNY